MNDKTKGIIIGMIMGITLFGSSVLAADGRLLEIHYSIKDILINHKSSMPLEENLKPFIYENRTFVPLRFVSEQLDKEVLWDDENDTVIINDKTPTPSQTDKSKPDWEVKADKVIEAAHYADFLNIPYVFGAEWKNDQAFDCSSFVLNLFLYIGIDLPRGSMDQAEQGIEVSRDELRKGDLVFFDVNGGKLNASHVGIYLGDYKFIHTNTPKAGIHVNNMEKDSYWKNHYVTARRILE